MRVVLCGVDEMDEMDEGSVKAISEPQSSSRTSPYEQPGGVWRDQFKVAGRIYVIVQYTFLMRTQFLIRARVVLPLPHWPLASISVWPCMMIGLCLSSHRTEITETPLPAV
jgi:hypothetical protein